MFGTRSRPAAMPIDAYRRGEEFVVHFELPGVDAESIDLTVERNVLTVHAQRDRYADDDDRGRHQRAARPAGVGRVMHCVAGSVNAVD
ncbi:MAG: Hsp20 family protein [Acidimicrobiales bacterium]